MPVIPRSEFRRLLGGLDSDRFVEFVADLWAARGYDTSVDGDTVVAEGDRGRTVIAVRHDGSLAGRARRLLGAGGAVDTDADLVVTSGDAADIDAQGTEALGAGDLYDMALYGIDRADCKAAFQVYLGRSPEVERESARSGRAREALSGGAVTVVVAALVVAAAAGPLGLVGPGGESPEVEQPSSADVDDIDIPAAPTTTPGTTPTATSATPEATPTATSATPETTEQPTERRAIELAFAHAEILANESFRFTSNQTWRAPDGSLVSYGRLGGEFEWNRTQYRLFQASAGRNQADSQTELWATDGRVFRQRTTGNETSYDVLQNRRGNPLRPRNALRFNPVYVAELPGLLGAVDTAEVELREANPPVDEQQWAPPTIDTILERGPPDDPIVFGVRADLDDGAVSRLDQYGTVENATMTAVVDSQGRFYSYTVSYEDRIGERTLQVTRSVEFEGVGSTTPRTPAWYDGDGELGGTENETTASQSSSPRM